MNPATLNSKQDRKFTADDFYFERHGIGAIGVAAKLIAGGQPMSFDCYKRIKDADNFMTVRREYEQTFYFGLLDLKEGIEGRSIALRVSNSNDLDAAGSHSLLASWTPRDITSNPIYIAIALCQFLEKHDNYFINI